MISRLLVGVVPGDGVIIRNGDVVVVIPEAGGPDAAVVESIVEAANRAAAASDPMTAVTEMLSELAASAPGVAAVVSGDDRIDIIVRGDVDVHVTSPGATTHVNGSDAESVVTRRLNDPVDRIVVGATSDPRTRSWLDLVEGTVPGSGVTVRAIRSGSGAIPAPPTDPPDDRGAPPAPPPEAPPAFESIAFVGQAASPAPAPAEVEPLPVEAPPSAEAADGADEDGDDGVQVEGLRCRRGHFNHPEAANCAWCGLAMVQDSYILVDGSRPPLGVLVVNEQTTFTLDADYVLGRSPQQDEGVVNGSRRPLALEDPDRSVSRVHACIELQGWDVVAIDRQSANGTWILEPGASNWERLVPNSPRPMKPGCHLQVGPHRLTYHSHHVR